MEKNKVDESLPKPGEAHDDAIIRDYLECIDCGAEYPESARVCPSCGTGNAPVQKMRRVKKEKIIEEGKKVKEWDFKEREELDSNVTKDPKLSILKTLLSKIPIPDIKPPKFENLKYEISRYLYKLMTVWNYCLQVEDNYAKSIVFHSKTMGNYRKAIKNALSMAIILSESDSFYRHRLRYFVIMVTSDMILNHYFYMIKKLGLEEDWNKKVLHIKFRTDAMTVTRDGRPGRPSREFGDLFAHLAKYEKGPRIWTDKKGRPLLRDDTDKSFKIGKKAKDDKAK